MNKNQEALREDQYIRNLIAGGETQQLDFKFMISDSRKIAKTVSAFSNTDGGRLLIGVKDNGAIAGVKSDEEYYMVEAAATLFCRPSVSFKVKKWIIEGKTILEVIIPKNENIVFAKNEESKWLAYVRVKDQNILANRVLIEVWKRKNKIKGTFIEYSKSENALLNYLAENKNISLSKFTKLSKLTRRAAEDILIDLASLDVIQVELNEKGALYSLKK
jgi:predicted HTH transcriptional regulator